MAPALDSELIANRILDVILFVLFFCVFVVHRKNPCVSFYSIEEIGVILET